MGNQSVGDPLERDEEQIHWNVRKLEAPFHKVYTAQEPVPTSPGWLRWYMLDQLGCAPLDILHVVQPAL